MRELINTEAAHLLCCNHAPLGQGATDNPPRLGLGLIYYSLVHCLKPDIIVEIGSFKGFSMLCMALACRDLGHGKVHFVDPSLHTDYWADGNNVQHILKEWDVQDYVQHWPHFSQDIYKLADFPPKIDVLLIDGDHSAQQAKYDTEELGGRVPNGGWILWHDAKNNDSNLKRPSVREYLQEEWGPAYDWNRILIPLDATLMIAQKAVTWPEKELSGNPRGGSLRSVSPPQEATSVSEPSQGRVAVTSSTDRPVSVTALLTVRNEAPHLDPLLDHYQRQGIDVCLIDQESDDETPYCVDHEAVIHYEVQGRPVGMEGRGMFSLQKQLDRKAEISTTCDADWYLCIDYDEYIQAPDVDQRLVDYIAEIDHLGYNTLEILHCVFVPTVEQPHHSEVNFLETMHHYYVTQLAGRNLYGWKARVDLKLEPHAVHFEEQKIAPEICPLRHYYYLSQEHARKKWTEDRIIDPSDPPSWHNQHNPAGIVDRLPLLSRTDQRLRYYDWPHGKLDLKDPLQGHLEK